MAATAGIRSRRSQFPGCCEVCRASSSHGEASIASCPGCAPCAGSPSFAHRQATVDVLDVVIIGGGPAGLVAAPPAGGLGARPAPVTRDPFGGMGGHCRTLPLRDLAHGG